MKISDLINGTERNTFIVVEINDLRQWHNEIVQDTIRVLDSKSDNKCEFVSPNEACQILHISRTTLTRWAKIGYLVPFYIGGKSAYKMKDIHDILNK